MRKIKYVFALLAAVLALTSAALAAVNGERVTGAEDFLRRAAAFSGEGVTLSVERGG